jgi:5-methylcytosine-specific restriction endonuclease McrA
MRYEIGQCQSCLQPISLISDRFCFNHYVHSKYYTNHRHGNRACEIKVEWVEKLVNKWVDQGGNSDGSGAAICPTTGRRISLEMKTAVLGHLLPTKLLTHCEFAHPSNIIWQDAQFNFSQRDYVPKGNELRPESPQVFKKWAYRVKQPVGIIRDLWYSKKWTCPYFGYDLYDTTQAHFDHISPISSGGSNEIINMQFVSCAANIAKGNLCHVDFLNWCKKVGHLSS